MGDPMEVALVRMATTVWAGTVLPKIDEMPFDTDRKRLSVICDTPQGGVLYCKGALEMLLPLCSEVLQQGKSCRWTSPTGAC